MRFKFSICFLLLFIIAATAFSGGSKDQEIENHFVIQNVGGEASYFERKLPAMNKMDLPGWWVQNLQAADVDFYIFKLEPGAEEMGIHGSPDKWFGYILNGEGILTLGDASGKELENVNFSKGDFLIFEPGAMHGWRNGEKETEILFIKKL